MIIKKNELVKFSNSSSLKIIFTTVLGKNVDIYILQLKNNI